jgi:hypothetical protein
MRSFKTKTLVTVIAVSLLKIVSCTPESCFEETLALLKASMYQSSQEKNVAPASLTLYGLNMEDDKIYDQTKNVKSALIPLNPSAESCTFVIGINSATDTLTFWYTSFPHLISKECGYTFYHTLDSLITTVNEIDTVTIRNKYVTTSDEENIRIYY